MIYDTPQIRVIVEPLSTFSVNHPHAGQLRQQFTGVPVHQPVKGQRRIGQALPDASSGDAGVVVHGQRHLFQSFFVQLDPGASAENTDVRRIRPDLLRVRELHRLHKFIPVKTIPAVR